MGNIKHTKKILNKNNNRLLKLDSLIEYSTNLSSSLLDFVESSKNRLEGVGYDAIRAELSYFARILLTQSGICEIVKSNFTQGNNYMINYLGDYDSLDTEKLEEIKRNLSILETLMINKTGELSDTISIAATAAPTIDVIGPYIPEKIIDGANAVSDYLSDLNNSYNEMCKLKDLLENLPTYDEEIDSNISETVRLCSKYSRKVSRIPITSKN